MQLLHADYKITGAARLGQKCGGFQNQEYDPSQMPCLFSMVLEESFEDRFASYRKCTINRAYQNEEQPQRFLKLLMLPEM